MTMHLRTKSMRKTAAMIIAMVFMFNIFLSAFPVPVAAATPEIVAAWDYTAVPASAQVPATSGTSINGAVLTSFKTLAPTYSTGSLSVNGWDNGFDSSGVTTKYWQISLSTSGYDNLTISAKTRSSGTGPRDFKAIYSTDNGSIWTDVPNGAYAITTTTLGNFMPTITLPADAADKQTLLVKFIMTSNVSSGSGVISPTGTSNINNIIVSGTPVTNLETVAGISISPEGGVVNLGSKVTLSCATEGSTIMYSINDAEFVQYDPANQVTLGTLPATVKAYGTKSGLTNSVTSSRSFTQAQVSAVTASPNGGAVTINKLVTLSCSTPNALIKYSLDNGAIWADYSTAIKLSELPASIQAYATADGMLVSGTSTFNYTLKQSGDYNIYFGQIHSHTTNSDGIGSPDDAYTNGAKFLDFLAVTDHSNSLDNAATSTMANASTSTRWVTGKASADAHTTSNFVGIYAYEMTWSNGTGHMNTFNTPGFENRETAKYKAPDGLKQYYNVLKNFPDSISQFNHPGSTFGDFNDFGNYDPQIDNQISLIEVGNGEGLVGSSGYFPSYEFYTRALDKGWHVSPTNNQDNHMGKWGNANTARTVILADSLSRDNIYEALKNMRTYATEDNNLRVKYTLNSEIMGTVIGQKPGSVNIKVELEDPDVTESLGKISVVANGGKVVATKSLTTNKETVEFTLAPDYSYYYIRIDEADKDIAVTAPVWIGEVEKAGIAKTIGSTTMPIKGEVLGITTSMYNNENVPMAIKSLEYSINGTTINTAAALADISSLGTATYKFDYTPTMAGKFNIDVKLIASINGVDKIFTDVLKIDVIDPVLVTRIVVDASHYNDYVSGYYSGNMTNLIALANQEKIAVVLQTGKITDEVLKNTQMLVLAPPSKKAGTANGVAYPISPYTADEITAITNYANNGGNIVVTALADFQDSKVIGDATNHSAYQQNLILAAIGAGSRINDDEVIDYENNPNVTPPTKPGEMPTGTAYRIPMNNYNTTSEYLANVVPAQNYSFYSGCSITLGTNATWLVKGTPTTYGFDSDNDKLGGSYVADTKKAIPADTGIGKGNMVALATENLPGGGKVFVGGTVFYSNFEIKVALDNASQLQNSNYNITMNILNSIKKVIPVTPINQVRAAQKGDTFCVEGIATTGTTPGNAFFDTIYIQDETAGINIFPVSGIDIQVGQKVRVIGSVDEYQGDKELRVIEISVADPAISPITPATMTTMDAMDSNNGGSLIKVKGKIAKVDTSNDIVSAIYIKDASGVEARLYVDGYIGYSNSGSDKIETFAIVGNTITGIGLASTDPLGNRLRVRDRSEIVLVDTTPPAITITSPENDKIYTTDVTPVVTTDDSTALVTMKLNGMVYTGATLVADGVYELIVTAVDPVGNSSEKTVHFSIDKTAPVITTNLKDGSVYNRINTFTLLNTAVDAIAGVEKLETKLDGELISNTAAVNLETLAFGSHQMVITAIDKVGNMAVMTVGFEIEATTKTLSSLLVKLYKAELIKTEGLYTSLNTKVVKGNLGAFLNEVSAQKGKGISIKTANTLKEYATWIMQK